jgi:hypothetical protein
MHKTTGAAIIFSAAILTCSRAAATTVTYNFDETGWINTAGTTENLFGSFTGTPEASGVLAFTDLTSFSATLTETNAQNDTKTIATFAQSGLTDFVFTSTSNSLTLSATGSPGALICLGDAVPQGTCGSVPARPVNRQGVPAAPVDGLFVSSVNGTLNAYSTSLPAIVMPLVPVPQPAPQPTGAAPEPASFLLCGGALLLTSMILKLRTRVRETAIIDTDGC